MLSLMSRARSCCISLPMGIKRKSQTMHRVSVALALHGFNAVEAANLLGRVPQVSKLSLSSLVLSLQGTQRGNHLRLDFFDPRATLLLQRFAQPFVLCPCLG